MFWSLIHLDLSFVQGSKNYSVYILLHVAIQFDHNHLLKMLSFCWCVVYLASLSNDVFIGVWTNVWIYDSNPLISMSIYLSKYHPVFLTITLRHNLKSEVVIQ